MKNKDYIKEEIATYRELLKLFVIIEIAIMGGSLNLFLDLFRNMSGIKFVLVIVGFISFFVNLAIIKKIWNKMYEFKFMLKERND
jgi:uncharacterized membrane protein YcjF (UPF0283 family)